MDFSDQIKSFSTKIPKIVEKIATEEATKNALVMPLMNILGYNVFDPSEVIPEFIADHGTKKGEKVDYAIMKDGKPTILIECKCIGTDLEKEPASQLFRYFSVTDAKVGILTNGTIYRFFTDLENKNKMDDKSFLEIDLLDLKEPLIKELKRFTKESFDLEDFESIASELKYTKEIKQILSKELQAPSEEFIRYFAKMVYHRPFNKNVRQKFSVITKNALNQFVNDTINERLKSVMTDEPGEQKVEEKEPVSENIEPDTGIITTPEEWESYYLVKAILRDKIESNRIAIRDVRSYCGVLLDDNNRKPICRFYFDGKQKNIGIFAENRKEQRYPLENIDDIFKYSEMIKNAIDIYEKQTEKS